MLRNSRVTPTGRQGNTCKHNIIHYNTTVILHMYTRSFFFIPYARESIEPSKNHLGKFRRIFFAPTNVLFYYNNIHNCTCPSKQFRSLPTFCCQT